jgi:plasmid stabilization system protein ParE
MRVTFDPAASAELDRIFAWISKDNPRAAFENDRPNAGEGDAT